MLASIFTSLIFLGAVLNPVLAGIYITNPVASTAAVGGQTLTVKWADDGNTPTLASVGPCSIDIYTGSKNSQTPLQNLAASVDVSKASSVTATVNANIGPNGDYYFVRFTSLSLPDPTYAQYKYEAFSAVFSMSGMTGSFNSSILAQIAATGGTTSNLPVASNTAANAVVTSSTTKSSTSATASVKSAASPQHAISVLLLSMAGAAVYFVL